MKKKKIEKNNVFLDIIVISLILVGVIVVFKYKDFLNLYVEVAALEDVDIESKVYVLKDKLEKQYNVKILYGRDTRNIVSKVNAMPIENESEIYYNLLQLRNSLSKYPDNIYANSKVYIVLLDKFNNNNIALATENNLGECYIYVSDSDKFERSFHHEMYHILEYTRDISETTAYNNWNALNPNNFNYISDTSKITVEYVYNYELESKNVFFCTKYSKASEKEDRAEIFAEIMTKEDLNFLKDNFNLALKTRYMLNVLNVVIPTDVNIENDFYWNKVYGG